MLIPLNSKILPLPRFDLPSFERPSSYWTVCQNMFVKGCVLVSLESRPRAFNFRTTS